MTTRRSPLTESDVETRDTGSESYFHGDLCGPWAATEIVLEDGFGQGDYGGKRTELSRMETARVIALARSKVWRAQRLRSDKPLFITRKDRNEREAKGGRPAQGFVWTSPEDLHQEAQRLDLDDKASLTLENLTLFEEQPGMGVRVPYRLTGYPGSAVWSTGSRPQETGITYASVFSEAPLVYKLLEERHLLALDHDSINANGTMVYVRPEGYSSTSRLREGRAKGPPQAFLICRFNLEMDAIFDSVYRPVGEQMGCPIRRVKDLHHVDRIDDRICAEIERATVVVVDLTDENFNVAFEAGYALALRKPIVWTKKKAASGLNLPFDIYTYNCLEWEPSDPESFRQAIYYRIQAALEKAERDRATPR